VAGLRRWVAALSRLDGEVRRCMTDCMLPICPDFQGMKSDTKRGARASSQ
jgi:hypothetical protein